MDEHRPSISHVLHMDSRLFLQHDYLANIYEKNIKHSFLSRNHIKDLEQLSFPRFHLIHYVPWEVCSHSELYSLNSVALHHYEVDFSEASLDPLHAMGSLWSY